MSSGTLPIAGLSKQRSPALAGLNYKNQRRCGWLARPLSSRCDGDHKNALFCRVLQKTRGLMRNAPLTADASASRSHLSRSARARPGEPNRRHGMLRFSRAAAYQSANPNCRCSSRLALSKVCLTESSTTRSLPTISAFQSGRSAFVRKTRILRSSMIAPCCFWSADRNMPSSSLAVF